MTYRMKFVQERTTMIAKWLEHLPFEHEVVGLIPSCDRPKSLKLLVMMAFRLGAQGYGTNTTTGLRVSG